MSKNHDNFHSLYSSYSWKKPVKWDAKKEYLSNLPTETNGLANQTYNIYIILCNLWKVISIFWIINYEVSNLFSSPVIILENCFKRSIPWWTESRLTDFYSDRWSLGTSLQTYCYDQEFFSEFVICNKTFSICVSYPGLSFPHMKLTQPLLFWRSESEM